MNNLQLIEKVLYYVEEHLEEEITYEHLAEVFGYSPFHFHRLFSAAVGQTVTDYLKKRRLTHACVKLQETDAKITDICYGCGFNSIQTFNRMFKDVYGMLPTDARKQKNKLSCKSVETILEGYKKRVPFKGDFVSEPKFVERDSFILAGPRKHTGQGFQVIGESWQELKANMGTIDRMNPNTMYGFEDYTEDFVREPLQFYYMAAVEIKDGADIPADWYVKKIPMAQYAVFTVNGNNASGEIGKAFHYIYHEWIPNSEYCLCGDLLFDFESYDERWDCQLRAAQMEIYIPVKKMGVR